jgi:general L-amino acid transport system permease protein
VAPAVAAAAAALAWVARGPKLSFAGRSLIVAAALGGVIAGAFLIPPSVTIDYPALTGFNFSGGGQLSPEFSALLLGLSLYTAAFVAEIVRAGILSVDRGQLDAAYSQGLSRGQALRLIVLPQALRAIVPPITSQYLNCVKNSSLAVAIGYPDLVSIANTTVNQTGQAIEGITIIMLVYLSISLGISALMNWYNRRAALRGVVA